MQKGEEGKLKVTAEALKKISTEEFHFHKMEVEAVLT
jgi:Ca2+-transporting ATPase